MIDRQKKKFVVLAVGFLLYLAGAEKSQQLSIMNRHFRHKKLLTMTRKPCQDAEGNKGVCIFKWDCLSQEGVSLTTCVDGFLFGSCCKLKVHPEIFPSEETQSENRIDITTRIDEREDYDDIQKKSSVGSTWKTSNSEPYYSGVTYSFHGDNIDAKGQEANQDGGVPLIYTLADKIQHERTEESGAITMPTEITQSEKEPPFRDTTPQSSFTNDYNQNKSSSKTETYSYGNVSSLSEISSSAITIANIPIVYTLTSQMPIVHNHSSENDNVSMSDSFDSTESEELKRTITGSSSTVISAIADSFDSTESEELKRTITGSSSTVISAIADTLTSKGTSHISTPLAAEVTEEYPSGTSSDIVSIHSGFTDFVKETDLVINNQNSGNHLNATVSALEETSGSGETNSSAAEERKKTTQADDLVVEKTMIHVAHDNSTVVEGLSAETISFHRNNSTETAHDTSHSNNNTPLSSTEFVFFINATVPVGYLPPSSETEAQSDNFENSTESSDVQFDNSERTTASNILVNTATTISNGGVLFESAGNYNTPVFDEDFVFETTTIHESEKLEQLTNTLLVDDSSTISEKSNDDYSTITEKSNTVRNDSDNLSILSDDSTYSHVNEDETVSVAPHDPSATSSLNEYNYTILNTPQYNNDTMELTFNFSSLLEKYNSSLVTTQDPSFDSTWFLIKLSEFFWDSLAFNDSADLSSEPEEHEITTSSNEKVGTDVQHVTHAASYPIETQPSSYSLPYISSNNLHSSVTAALLGYQTDISDRDETIYQNLLSIMEYNGNSTTPIDHSQGNLESNHPFGDDEKPQQFFENSTVSDYTVTDVKGEITETDAGADVVYDHGQVSEYPSTVHDSSSIYDHEDTNRVVDFIAEVGDKLDADTNAVSLTTEYAFSEINTADTDIQIKVENDTENHTSVVNSDDVSYSHEEYLVNTSEKLSLDDDDDDDEDTTFSETSDHEINFSATRDPFVSETEPSTTAHFTETDLSLISSSDSQESSLSQTSTIKTTKEITHPAQHSSSTYLSTALPNTHEETTTYNSSDFTVGVSTDSDDPTDLTTPYIPKGKTTTQTSFTLTHGDVSTNFHAIPSTTGEAVDTYVEETIPYSSSTSKSTTNQMMTVSEKETTAVPEEVSEKESSLMTNSEKETTAETEEVSETETPLMTTLERETTTSPTILETTTKTTSTSGKETTTESTTTSESVTSTKPTTTSVTAPLTSLGPTYTTQKYSISQQLPSPPKLDYRKNCGVRTLRPTGRIVGGKDTFYGKWPWQALVKEAAWLGLFVKNKCGGVLINSKFVITAAHCQPGFLGTLIVVLGAHDLSGAADYLEPVARNVKRMVIHRHYNAQTFENDLALLEMESPVEFVPHVVPICLPHRNEDFTGKMAFVTGWGKLTHGGDVPNILQEVQVPIVTNGECQKMYLYAGHEKLIRSHFVCAGYSRGGQDSCEGDSGGPLMVRRDDGRWVLVGTVSHGIGCADPNLPGVYMRMSAYRPWIDSIIRRRNVVRQKQVNRTAVISKKTRRSRTLVFYI